MPADKRIFLPGEFAGYVEAQAEPPTPPQRWLIDTTTGLGDDLAEMQIPHEQGVFLTLFAKSISAVTVLDIGTFTGYSALCLAAGLAPGGVVHTLDITDRWTDTATHAWKEAGVFDRVHQHIGPAAQTLARFPAGTRIDLAFIDADKVSYIEYWELLVPMLRPGGVVLADNVLYAGEAALDNPSGNGLAIQKFNAHVRADDRVESVLLTIADGLTLAYKKGVSR